MTFILGITGGIGSGKSAATQWFESQGIVVIDADIDLIFHVEHFYYEYDYSFLCEFLYKISNYIIFAAYIGCAFIIAGVRNG